MGIAAVKVDWFTPVEEADVWDVEGSGYPQAKF